MPAFPEPLCLGHYDSPDSLRFDTLKEKILLYTDCTLLYLHDAHSSMQAALAIFDEFGKYLGIRINWNKSVLFPLDPGARKTMVPTPLLRADELKYLDVKVRRDLGNFFNPNLSPMLQQLEKCISWLSLPLNLKGRINILKMIFLPKFNNNFFRNCPIWIGRNFFQEADSCSLA